MSILKKGLFWNPLTFIIWTKTIHNISFCALQKKASHTGLEHTLGWVNDTILHFWVNFPFKTSALANDDRSTPIPQSQDFGLVRLVSD